MYWISAWQASQGQTHTPSAATFQAVSAQLSSNLAQSEEFTAMSDAQKQEMTETLLIQAALIDASLEQAAANPEQLQVGSFTTSALKLLTS